MGKRDQVPATNGVITNRKPENEPKEAPPMGYYPVTDPRMDDGVTVEPWYD